MTQKFIKFKGMEDDDEAILDFDSFQPIFCIARRKGEVTITNSVGHHNFIFQTDSLAKLTYAELLKLWGVE